MLFIKHISQRPSNQYNYIKISSNVLNISDTKDHHNYEYRYLTSLLLCTIKMLIIRFVQKIFMMGQR